MFWRVLRQSVFQGRRRKILAGVTVCLAATLGMALATRITSYNVCYTKLLRAHGYTDYPALALA